MNIRKDLRDLFRKSLINSYNASISHYNSNCSNYGKDIVLHIYFYEWSDITRAPLSFYNINVFNKFLESSGIYMANYQKDIVNNLGYCFITCYPSTRDLAISGTYRGLMTQMEKHKEASSANNDNRIKSPSIVFEGYNRMPQNDGTFFG